MEEVLFAFHVCRSQGFIGTGWAGLSVLEIGSHNVNGSVRPFFAGSEYVGVDLSEGRDVDTS